MEGDKEVFCCEKSAVPLFAGNDNVLKSILDFLTLEDLCNLAICNKQLFKICNDHVPLGLSKDRHVGFFKERYSKSWWSWFHRMEDHEFADDLPFEQQLNHKGEQLRNYAKGGLHKNFQRFAVTESLMIESIMEWCGGWEKFFNARYHGAEPASSIPRAPTTTTCTRAGDKNKVHRLCRPVVIFDIHRDCEWIWSAIHPLDQDDIRTLIGNPVDRLNKGIFYPYSTKCLGDEVCPKLTHPWNDWRRPTKYLLSTDSSDSRTYKFSVSIVSPNFAETFVESNEIVPSQICEDQDGWVMNDNNMSYDEDSQEDRRQYPPLWKKERIVVGGQRHNFGMTNDGVVVNDSPKLRFNFYRQISGQCERLQVTMDAIFKTTHFYDMWVRMKAPGPLRRSKRKRNCSFR